MKLDMMNKELTLDEINRALDLACERDPSIEPEPGYSCGDSESHWAVPNAEELGPESTLVSELERIHLAFRGGDRAIRAAIMAHLAAFKTDTSCRLVVR